MYVAYPLSNRKLTLLGQCLQHDTESPDTTGGRKAAFRYATHTIIYNRKKPDQACGGGTATAAKARLKQNPKQRLTMGTEYILRISVAAILGGIIGLERNYRAKEAGFRTHFLVALGSSLFMIISQYGLAFDMTEASDISFDPSRIASQVVTGIGFIGAGTIILQKHVVRGLTTAAGLWVTSAIGLACGSGMYALASAATVFVLICLEILSVMLDRFGTRNMSLTFTAPDRQSISHTIGKLKKDRVRIYNYSIKEQHSPEGNKYKVSMEIKVKRTQYESKMAEFLNEYDGVSIESIE